MTSTDIQEERNHASFDVNQLSTFLFGGEKNLKRYDSISKKLDEDPVFDHSDNAFLTRSELYKRYIQKNAKLITILDSVKDNEEKDIYIEIAEDYFPISGLHEIMFIPAIQNQGTEEQKSKWLPLAMDYKIIGTYAQTELGHGSNIRNLETTATYDPQTQEFVLNTPTLTATKWWPGSLGKIANHCIVMAKLIIRNKDYGLHGFICQIRDVETHKLRPGIMTGDIGPKMGANAIDNGWMKLDHVRIPRDQMLMRFAQVTPEGEYVKPIHDKLSYSTMLYVRSTMTRAAYVALGRAITIAIRYSSVRRQGYMYGNEKVDAPELKILDYGSQQYSLFPILSQVYALNFTSVYIKNLYNQLNKDLLDNDFSLLPEVHANLSGLKVIATWMASYGIEECRQRCGGSGFLQSSGLPEMFCSYVPATTFEGDNNLLLQQTARYLVKVIGMALENKEVSGNDSYFKGVHTLDKDFCMIKSSEELLDPNYQITIYTHKAIRMAYNLYVEFRKTSEELGSMEQGWNFIMSSFYPATKAYILLIMVKAFISAVNRCEDPSTRRVLKNLCDLFCLYHLEEDKADLLIDGYFNGKHINLLSKTVRTLLQKVRKDAVPLVDAFRFSDRLLNSAIGRYDGNIYPALFNFAKRDPFFNNNEVVDGYKQYIYPLLKKNKL